MSQIDQAFLKAYAKDRGRTASPVSTPAQPAAQTATQPASQPASSSAARPTTQPGNQSAPHNPRVSVPLNSQPESNNFFAHLPSPLAAPHVNLSPSYPEVPVQQPTQITAQPSLPRHEPSIHTTSNASRQRSSSSVRIDPPATTSQQPIAGPVESSLQTTRKTLSSYFQQARASVDNAPSLPIPTVATRWSQNTPQSQAPAAQTKSQSLSQTKFQTPVQPSILTPVTPVAFGNTHPATSRQDFNESVDRGSEYNAWQFQVVERGVKSTSTSDGPSAKIRNPGKPNSFLRIDRPHHDSLESNPFTRPLPTPVQHLVQPSPASQRNTEPMAPATGYDSPPKAVSTKPFVEKIAKLALPVTPTWEVDEFHWPATVAGLMQNQPEAIRDIGLHLQHAASKGLRTLAITSGERGVGRSTVAMCIAKAVSKAGLRVALVDCDYECPSLVDQLNLEVAHGWQECILNNVPLDEVAVHAVKEQITFFPSLAAWSNSQVETHQIRINKLLKRIALGYDLVILDCNRINGKQQTLCGLGEDQVIDAALVIVDAQLSLRQRVDGAIEALRRSNINSIGIAENFHSQG